MQLIDKLYIAASLKLAEMRDKFAEDAKEFYESEAGVSNVVATIIILALVVLIIGVFWDKLQAFLKKMFEIIFNFEPKADGMS